MNEEPTDPRDRYWAMDRPTLERALDTLEGNTQKALVRLEQAQREFREINDERRAADYVLTKLRLHDERTEAQQ